MIGYSAGQLALMTGPAYNIWLKAILTKPDGSAQATFVDFGSGGDNRIRAASLNASIDLATIEGTLTFDRGLDGSSLSPFIGASTYNSGGKPLLYPGTIVSFLIAITAAGVAPVTDDFRVVLDGVIDHDNVAAGPDSITIRFRDKGVYLLGRFIEAPATYGSTGGTLAETVMTSIVGAWPAVMNGLPLSFTTPAASAFMLQQFRQERMPVLEACRRIAMQIGWEFRYYASLCGGSTACVFRDPDRAKASQATIGPSIYRDVTRLEVSDDDVRNRWKVGYPTTVGEPKINFVTVDDTTSQGRHGIRFAEVVFDRSSNINSLAEATAYANVALADTKDPLADFAVELLAFPAVELNDVYTFPANGVHLDASQVWSIAGYQHNFSKGSGHTTLFTRGKPIAYYRDYRRGLRQREFTSTLTPPVDFFPPEGSVWDVVESVSFTP